MRHAGVPERFIKDPDFIRSRPLLREPGVFDAPFFDMTAPTAKSTDPCHRLFMTCAWEAMERAGIVPGPEAGVVGIYGGGGSAQES
jgi:acyl transferase domain-containing protein